MINDGSLGRPLGLASGTSNENTWCQAGSGPVPFLLQGRDERGSQHPSTQQQEGRAKQRAMLLRPPGVSAQASPGGPKTGCHWGSRHGFIPQAPKIYLKNSLDPFQAWGHGYKQEIALFSKN